MEYYVDIWQVSPQLSRGEIYQNMNEIEEI